MPELSAQKNVILLCDSWYAKKDLVCVVDEYANLDVICNARYDSVIYDLAPQPTGKRGRPAKHGRRLCLEDDFTLSNEKFGDYYIGVRQVLTNLFGHRQVLAYVTASKKHRDPGDCFSAPDADILCLAGKGILEPNRKQPYAVYASAVLLFQVEH